MAHYYLDSSALVKRYVDEPGTEWIQGICAPEAHHILLTVRISAVEVVAALKRTARTGSLSEDDADKAIRNFKAHFVSDYQIVEVNSALTDRAMALAEAHGMRGCDAVQLAAACEIHAVRSSLALSPLTLVSADTTLNEASVAEGLVTVDPNSLK